MSEESHTSPGPSATPVAGSFESLQQKALELMKNPLVAAGGALVVGLLIARLTSGNKMRQSVLTALAALLKNRQFAADIPTTPDPPPAPDPVPEAAPPDPKQAELSDLGHKLLSAVAPQIEQFAKKKLEEFFPGRH